MIELKHVSKSYTAGVDALKDINLTIKDGEIFGIIGQSGAGKSTILNLVIGFNQAESGKVLIDGKDISKIDLRTYRKHLAVVPQTSILFSGTIRDNIRWGKKDATDTEIMEALDIAQAREFVEKKDGKLDSFVDQGGKNLSGGQRQRLTIARAVVRKPDILILDDSASALDYATDAALRKSIREMKDAPTLFIVSQRAASLMHADRIIVLDDGNVAGIGTHEELLENCEVYQEIYYSQFRKEKEA